MAGCPARRPRPRTDPGAHRTLAAGNPGDVAPVGEGVSELRIDVGPGYRVYFTRRGRAVIILLAGGSKHTQTADIRASLGRDPILSILLVISRIG